MRPAKPLAAMFIVFITAIALSSSWILLNNRAAYLATGKAVSAGTVIICLNSQPTILPVENQNAATGVLFSLYVSGSDSDNNSLTFSDNAAMFNITTLNATRGLINFTPTVSYVGNSSVNITANDGVGCVNSANSIIINFSIIKINHPPALAANIPDATWDENTRLVNWIDLDDYFSDPDGDALTCYNTSVSNIAIRIDSNNLVTLTPDNSWYGLRKVYFNCTDSVNSTLSNEVTLIVEYVSSQITLPSTGGGGGGGGGGVRTICEEYWTCSEWSECNESGIQSRACTDFSNCSTIKNKPNETQRCRASTCKNGLRDPEEIGIDCGGLCEPCQNCYDKIQNQNETGIDCGGLCEPCPTCSDGEQNGNESGIDCGGLCEPCQNCYDKIKNQNETGIDCGGPCKPCTVIEKPAAARRGVYWIVLMLIILTITAMAAKHYGPTVINRIRLRVYMGTKLASIKRQRAIALTLSRLSKMERELPKIPIEYSVKELDSAAKEFFKEWLGLPIFSYQELANKLKKERLEANTRANIELFANNLMIIEKFNYKVTNDDVAALIGGLRLILETISKGEK